MYLSEAIESILNQTFTDFIFYILDDGSTDETYSILNNYAEKDPRIIVLTNRINEGITNSLNTILDSCHSTYIARMDADDIAHPNRFSKQIDFLSNHRDVSVCGSWVNFFGKQHTTWKTKQTDEEIKAKLLFSNALAHPSIMFRSEIKSLIKPLYQDTFSPVSGFEDYELLLKLSPFIKFYNLQEPLLDRRIEIPRENQSIQKLAFIKTFIKQALGYDLDEVTEQMLHYLIDNDSNSFNTKSITNAIQPIKERYIEYLKLNRNEIFSKAFDKELAYQIRRRMLQNSKNSPLIRMITYVKSKLP